ncbi:hypothetical protein KC327_g6 [Hortaea werneckii]|nr:hypothetical protein KC327_g6 [Hortaea werneckii]
MTWLNPRRGPRGGELVPHSTLSRNARCRRRRIAESHGHMTCEVPAWPQLAAYSVKRMSIDCPHSETLLQTPHLTRLHPCVYSSLTSFPVDERARFASLVLTRLYVRRALCFSRMRAQCSFNSRSLAAFSLESFSDSISRSSSILRCKSADLLPYILSISSLLGAAFCTGDFDTDFRVTRERPNEADGCANEDFRDIARSASAASVTCLLTTVRMSTKLPRTLIFSPRDDSLSPAAFELSPVTLAKRLLASTTTLSAVQCHGTLYFGASIARIRILLLEVIDLASELIASKPERNLVCCPVEEFRGFHLVRGCIHPVVTSPCFIRISLMFLPDCSALLRRPTTRPSSCERSSGYLCLNQGSLFSIKAVVSKTADSSHTRIIDFSVSLIAASHSLYFVSTTFHGQVICILDVEILDVLFVLLVRALGFRQIPLKIAT